MRVNPLLTKAYNRSRLWSTDILTLEIRLAVA